MAQTVCVLPPAEDRKRLLAIVADRNRPLKHVRRAHIVLCSADCLPVQEVARRARVSRPAVWRWQARYAEQGVEGLLRDKTRKPGRPPLSAKVVAKVLDLTCSEPPGQATHWTGRAMAKAVGVSLRAVQRLWEAHRLQPHRIRTFKRSNDPEFAEKVEDIVGLYMDPPKHAVVVSIDEKSQIQALDRTQPGLPLPAPSVARGRDNLCPRQGRRAPPRSAAIRPPRDCARRLPMSAKASSYRPRRPDGSARPRRRRCRGRPRAPACRPDASSRPSSWRSSPRGRSGSSNPRSTASCLCACGRSAPGPRRSASRRRSPAPSASASLDSSRRCRAERSCAAQRWPPSSTRRRRSVPPSQGRAGHLSPENAGR